MDAFLFQAELAMLVDTHFPEFLTLHADCGLDTQLVSPFPATYVLLCLVCCALLGSQCCCCIDGVYGVSTLLGVVSEVVYFLCVFR